MSKDKAALRSPEHSGLVTEGLRKLEIARGDGSYMCIEFSKDKTALHISELRPDDTLIESTKKFETEQDLVDFIAPFLMKPSGPRRSLRLLHRRAR